MTQRGKSLRRQLPFISETSQFSRRAVNMKPNRTGRSIKGGGARGKSNSPCSQSGLNPDLARGSSSQLNFEMTATREQIENISRSF